MKENNTSNLSSPSQNTNSGPPEYKAQSCPLYRDTGSHKCGGKGWQGTVTNKLNPTNFHPEITNHLLYDHPNRIPHSDRETALKLHSPATRTNPSRLKLRLTTITDTECNKQKTPYFKNAFPYYVLDGTTPTHK